MKNVIQSLRAAVLALIVGVLVACTPGGGGTSAPAASGGAPASVAPAAPASVAPPAPGY
jgi:hypothetical protein